MTELIKIDATGAELMIIPSSRQQLEAVFVEQQDLTGVIDRIRAEAAGLPTDMSERKNRDAVASFAYKIARSKTAIEKAGAALSKEYKELPKKIDASRKAYKDAFEALQAEVRRPLNDWEAAEEHRIAQHQALLERVKRPSGLTADRASSSAIQQIIKDIEAVVIGDHLEEFAVPIAAAKDATLASLREALAQAEKREAEQAELERLRSEAEERERKDREERIAREAAETELKKAEQARIEAEQRAEAEKREAERAIQEAKAAAELAEQKLIAAEKQAELDKIEAEKRTKEAADRAAQHERERIAAEKAAEEAEQKKREADKAHKKAVNRQALDDLLDACPGLTAADAKGVIEAIVRGMIRNCSIKY